MFWAAHITSTTGVLKCRNLKKYSYTKVLRTCRLGRVVRMQFRTQLWAGMVRFTTLHGNLWGEGIQIQDQPIKTQNLVSWSSRKSSKYYLQMSHFKAEMHVIRFLASVRLSLCPLIVCSFVDLCLRWSLALYNKYRAVNDNDIVCQACVRRLID